MASVYLNTEMREEIAFKLMLRSLSKDVEYISKKLDHLNKWFWKNHLKRIEKIFPVDKSLWAGLEEKGLINARYNATPKLSTVDSKIAYRSEIVSMALTCKHLCSVSKFVYAYGGFYEITFVSNEKMPYFLGMTNVTDEKMSKEIKETVKDISNLFHKIDEMYNEAIVILKSCRTTGQVYKIFPDLDEILDKPKVFVPCRLDQKTINSFKEKILKGS